MFISNKVVLDFEPMAFINYIVFPCKVDKNIKICIHKIIESNKFQYTATNMNETEQPWSYKNKTVTNISVNIIYFCNKKCT